VLLILSPPLSLHPWVGHVVPVHGHWPSSTCCEMLFTVGDSRAVFSDRKAKTINSARHAAKRKSMATKSIISLVGMVSVFCEKGGRPASSRRRMCKRRSIRCREETRREGEERRDEKERRREGEEKERKAWGR